MFDITHNFMGIRISLLIFINHWLIEVDKDYRTQKLTQSKMGVN